MKNIFKLLFAALLCLTLTVSCSDFLDRPAEDSFTTANFYQNDTQCEQGVYYLYSSPWYDIILFYIYGSETMAGNVYQGSSAYLSLTVNGSDEDLKNMSASLWAVNAQCNTVVKNIVDSEGPTQECKNKCIGEALAWKAMAYFMLVRSFGPIPIIHSNLDLITDASYNQVQKVELADVYEYIIMTLEKAIDLLPVNPYIGEYPRIDKYAAEGLLAKVYLAKAGVSGSLSNDDLNKALKYAEDVIDNSGRSLTPKYEDVFRLSPSVYQQTGECLFSWLWTATSNIWTCQNSIQCDVGLTGFDEYDDVWGDWKGPSVSLQDAFGVSAADDPSLRTSEKDSRRKATMMMMGDKYSHLWMDQGGFDIGRFFYDDDYKQWGGQSTWPCQSGAEYAKHLYGSGSDHLAQVGVSASRMCNQLPTHILRLSDVYLVAAEAAVLTGNDGAAKVYVNAVRRRAGADELDAVDWDTVWKERRLELALEGDRWYDFVRRSYYDAEGCINELLAQRRSHWDGISGAYANYVQDGTGAYEGPGANPWNASDISYNNLEDLTDVKASVFTLPMPDEDVVLNPNMGSGATPIHVDVRNTYSFDF